MRVIRWIARSLPPFQMIQSSQASTDRYDVGMAVRVVHVDLNILNMRTRMPFKYGIATLTSLPHLFVRLLVDVDGVRVHGLASDGLPPKWFTKDPNASVEDEIDDMFAVIRHACEVALEVEESDTVFDLWQQVHTMQAAWAASGRVKAQVKCGADSLRPPLPPGEGWGEGQKIGDLLSTTDFKTTSLPVTEMRPFSPGAPSPALADSGTLSRRERGGAAFPPLLWGFGVSLVERAVIDGFCRARRTTFGETLRTGGLGLRLEDLHRELHGASPAQLLPSQPLRRVIARHTVGLADPLTESDIPVTERLADGLPQSLESCIAAYGLTHFKIKLSGDAERDIDRMRRIAAIVGDHGAAFAFTLDGNEFYRAVAPFRELWQRLRAEPDLRAFFRGLLFVEQPFHRDVALCDELGRDLRAWGDRPALIIDESDGEIGSAATALRQGYGGTSFKNCKGVFKGIANACMLEQRRRHAGGDSIPPISRPAFILSGEDLANVGPVAVLQDLCVAANLGITHVERNGHHYFRGLSMLPDDVQESVLAAHGDLYRRHERGYATLNIARGAVDTGSVVDAPFGVGLAVDSTRFTPIEQWRHDSLG